MYCDRHRVGACKITERSSKPKYGDIDEWLENGTPQRLMWLATRGDGFASGSDIGESAVRADNSLYADLFLDGHPEKKGSIMMF